jgi:hypothetical protein
LPGGSKRGSKRRHKRSESTTTALHGRIFGLSFFTHLRRSSAPGPISVDENADAESSNDAEASNDAESSLDAQTKTDPGTNADARTNADAESTPGPGPDSDDAGGTATRWRVGPVLAGILTVLAFLSVFFALVSPNQMDLLTPRAFVRIPIEALLGIPLVLALPGRIRKVVAGVAGAVLGLLTILKVADMGFYSTLNRPFDPVYDWLFLRDGLEFLNTSSGRLAAIGATIGAALLVFVVPALMTLSVLRLTRLAVRYRDRVTALVVVLAVVWISCASLGAQIVPGIPVAARSAAGLAYGNVRQSRHSLNDRGAYAKEAAVDPFQNTPGDQLLTGLRGKDVVLAFIESYGRSAVEDPTMAPQVDAVLDAGTKDLKKAGFASRSGYLTSTTMGGGSWLAHGTTLSGLRIDTQQRYNTLVSSNRLTLNGAFHRADWRTVAVMPGLTRAWPEGDFFGYDKIYGDKDLGYHGPSFSWATMPDQFVLNSFQKAERSQPGHTPVMAEMPLVSSHAPWAPIPTLIDWDKLGDGSVFDPMPAAGRQPNVVWRDPAQVRNEYRRSIEYTLTSLISYLEKYGDKNLVMIFLGDHQPIPLVTGKNASRDVPITIVAKDPAVLDRVSSWGWTDGLKPDPKAPVWPMAAFRNRFLAAFGPK